MKTMLALLCCLGMTNFAQQMDGLRDPRTPPAPVKTIAQEFPELIFHEDMVENMQKLLWPDADGSMKNGPVDGGYYAPTKAEIEDLLSFVRARKELIPHIPDAWDCDNFAIEFYYLSQLWSVRHTGGAPVAVAVGIAYVKLDGPYPLFRGEPYAKGYHAINVILRNDGQWFFVEPQNGAIVPIEGSIYEGAIEVVKIAI